MTSTMARRFAAGAECLPQGGVDFRVWAPDHQRVELLIGAPGEAVDMRVDGDGYFRLRVENAAGGTLYRYRVDGRGPYPDPASRFQPSGPEGPSEVIDPAAYTWHDASWRGRELRDQVLYELHLGTFTPEGTLAAAQTKLTHLRECGVTTIELMPLADFMGDFGWGYDGLNLYAPHRCYGRPDDLRSFVDAAHQLGLGVILDVVYNHLGPFANYLPEFSTYYTSKRATEWGAGLNFDAEQAGPVRALICDNAAYWISEFHLDGFRLDATQSLIDGSEEHIVAALTRRARSAAGERSIVVLAENEPQDSKLMRPAAVGGYGIDGMWNDDFHHSAVVALTGRREAYYSDYAGRAQEFVAAAKYGFLYQGQYYSWQKQRRGRSARGLAPWQFIAYLENHDQVANSAAGDRLAQIAAPGTFRAMTALLLLGPWTPLLFQGQEWSSARPFNYFAQHASALAAEVAAGRKRSLAQFPSLASRAVQAAVPDPGVRQTFQAAKLDWAGELTSVIGQRSLQLHRELLRLRREDAVLKPGAPSVELHAVALSDSALALRWYAPDDHDRLLLVNFSSDLVLCPAPEPLLAPPDGRAFRLLLSTEEPRYGGLGQPDDASDASGLRVPARAALLFQAVAREE